MRDHLKEFVHVGDVGSSSWQMGQGVDHHIRIWNGKNMLKGPVDESHAVTQCTIGTFLSHFECYNAQI